MRRTRRCKQRLRVRPVTRVLRFRTPDIPSASAVTSRTERTSTKRRSRARRVMRRSRPPTTAHTQKGFHVRAVISLTTSSRRASLKFVRRVMRPNSRAPRTTKVTPTARRVMAPTPTNPRPRRSAERATQKNKQAHLQVIKLACLVTRRTMVRFCRALRAGHVMRKRKRAFTGKSRAVARIAIDLTGPAESSRRRSARRAMQRIPCPRCTRSARINRTARAATSRRTRRPWRTARRARPRVTSIDGSINRRRRCAAVVIRSRSRRRVTLKG
jgi:hypothetical protein